MSPTADLRVADGRATAAAPHDLPPPRAERVKRYYFREMASYLRFLVPPGESVLEISCRDGTLLAQLAPSRGVGLDASPEFIATARARHPHLTFVVGAIGSLPVEGTFDVIVLTHVVDFLDDVQGAIESLRRLCHPGTRLILITHNYLWAPVLVLLERLGLKRTKGAYAWLSLNDLQNILSFAKFDVVRREYRTVLPVWIPVVSWVANRMLGKLPVIWKLGMTQWVVAFPLGLGRDAEPPSVSVIIPCRNERGTIETIVERTPEMGRRTELVFVEGHSTDGTLDALREVQQRRRDRDIKVLAQDGEGKGDAVRKGIEASSGEIIVILDADLSVAPQALPRFVEALAGGYCELALGSRLVYPMPAHAMRPLNMLANMLFGRAISFMIGQQVKDTLCGTKAFWRRDCDRMALQRAFFGVDDPFGDFDLILGAAKLSLKIREIPVQYHERVYGTTNIRRWRHGLMLSVMLAKALIKLKLQ